MFLLKSDAVVAISKQIYDYYISKIKVKKEKVHLITNGIDLSSYQKANGNHLRDELGIEEYEKVLGMVANIRPEKNHKLLISAFSIVAKEIKNVSLILVGLDCMGGEMQEFASKTWINDKILFLGQRSDVPELLKVFHIFCLPSIYEGMPLTVLEAMASGVPVIGSDVLGINEVIRDNVNGLLFCNNDERKLAELIKRLLKDNELRQRLIQEGKSFVEKYHDLDDRIKDYDRLFQMVYQSK
jgi:glycosyltransferase involved in cell wall biosynthesis